MSEIFQHTKHRKLYSLLRDNWNIVKQCGFLDYKTFLCQSEFLDFNLYNSCYACDYAVNASLHLGESYKCKFCPINIGTCSSPNSIFQRILESIKNNNEAEYKYLCNEVLLSRVKDGVQSC